MEKIEDLIKQIEKEVDFEKLVDLFARASMIIKQNLETAKVAKGKLIEIIRDVDGFIEREFNPQNPQNNPPKKGG